MQAFITGSQKYGAPDAYSDFDLVVFMSKEDAELLNESQVQKIDGEGSDVPEDGSFSLRFGKLNLLICTRLKDYLDWQQGTATLAKWKAEAGPIARKDACDLFAGLRDSVPEVKEDFEELNPVADFAEDNGFRFAEQVLHAILRGRDK